MRKLWRRIIKDSEMKILDQNLDAKMWAFKKLKYSYEDRQQALWGTLLSKLKTQCVKNIERLDRLADTLENSGSAIKDLTDQREILLNGKISGQKLAFALSVQN